MNIWIFNHYANGPGVNGVTRHFDLAKNLVNKGHNITIFCSSFNHWNKKDLFTYEDNEFYKIVMYEGVKFVYFKTTSYSTNGLGRIRSMFSFYSKTGKFKYSLLDEKPDYVLGSILHHFAALRAYKISKKYSAKFLFEERDLWPATLVDLGKVGKNNPIVKILDLFERFMYKKAEKIIVLFEKADLYVKSKGISENKILYLPNGADINKYLVIQNRKMPKKELVIGYIGAHSLANNLNRVVDLAEKLNDYQHIKFRFVGEGTYKEELIKKVQELGITNCTFENGVPKEQVPSILAQCDFGIVSLKDSPLYNYGFSLNKLYDYMGAKLPIILDTAIQDTFITKNNIGIANSNLDEIKSLLVGLTEEQYESMSQNAFEYVSKEHDWSKLADKFLFAIQERE